MLQATEIIGSTTEATLNHHLHPDEWVREDDDGLFPSLFPCR